jgi:predicted glycogen debranching enzyme
VIEPLARPETQGTQTQLSRCRFARAPAALEHEWLVTNGLGGFACGTVAQANTRRYHGLLIAALRPPVERTLMVAKVDATVRSGGRVFQLGCNEFADGTLAPRGFELLSDFRLEHGIPVWTYALKDALLEQRIWMPHARNTTCLQFTLHRTAGALELELVPLCTYRDYHGHTQGGWTLDVAPEERGCRVTAHPGARPCHLFVDRGRFHLRPDWYWRFLHREEMERGLDGLEDLFRPGVIEAQLAPGETLTLTTTAEPDSRHPVSLDEELRRRARLPGVVPEEAPHWIRRLTLAADSFLVRRGSTEGAASPGTTVIAGYPWFSDWGRDTMIALPGLTLCTGRPEAAATILRTFAEHTSQGMLPNRFPDDGTAPEYNTADATLWFFHAMGAYLDATRDRALLRELYPTFKDIIHWHRKGTRYGIHADPADELLHVGESGVQLTWMDAKVGDWVVTPRTGKPVEINALWHLALSSMERWASLVGDAAAAADFHRGAERVAHAFAQAFWYEDGGYLYDVIDCEDPGSRTGASRVDRSLRPNQVLALSLGPGLLDARRARSVIDVCVRELLTPVGLRSLAPGEKSYAGEYRGGQLQRDGAYHQGTVWSWLLGPFALAHYQVYGDAAHALALLAGLAPHLDEACLGTISEIFDGNAPHAPRGCFAQAWSVGETLRAWHLLERAQAQRDNLPRHPGPSP